MEEFAYTVLFITTANTEEAQRISSMLLNQKKTACANIVPKASSLFWWQRRDLNPRPKAYESSALPLSYAAKQNIA